jgi:hypothetical protein
MTVEFRIYLSDNGLLEDLREWMGDHSGVELKAVAHPSKPNSQGSVWEFLAVVCAAGGPIVAAVRALQLWIEARVTVIEIEVGDRRITVTSHDAKTVLPQVVAAAQALEAAAPENPAVEAPDEPAR